MESCAPVAAQNGSGPAVDAEFLTDESQRRFLQGAGLLVAGMLLPQTQA